MKPARSHPEPDEVRSASKVDLAHLPPVLRVDEVAEVLRIGRRAAYDLVATGQLASVRVGHRTIRVPRAAVERFLDAEPADGR